MPQRVNTFVVLAADRNRKDSGSRQAIIVGVKNSKGRNKKIEFSSKQKYLRIRIVKYKTEEKFSG